MTGSAFPQVGLTPEHLKKIYVFEFCEVCVDDPARYMQTTFFDGSIVSATPNYSPQSFCLAGRLGYGLDVWGMSKDHELIHTWLSGGLSPTLWRMANLTSEHDISDNDVAEEESRVFDFQKNLDKFAPRPWENA